jgi:hypothetical protein
MHRKTWERDEGLSACFLSRLLRFGMFREVRRSEPERRIRQL